MRSLAFATMTDVSNAIPVDPQILRRRRATVAGTVVAGLLAIVAVIVLVSSGSAKKKAKTGGFTPARIVTVSELKTIATGLGFPLYWAGNLKNARIEYSTTAQDKGRYFVRYLSPGATPGDPRGAFLTIGTYPQDNAYSIMQKASKVPAATSVSTKSGALVVNDRRKPTSVFFAFPNANYQVEVFDPSPARARRLVLGGTIRRVI